MNSALDPNPTDSYSIAFREAADAVKFCLQVRQYFRWRGRIPLGKNSTSNSEISTLNHNVCMLSYPLRPNYFLRTRSGPRASLRIHKPQESHNLPVLQQSAGPPLVGIGRPGPRTGI